MNKGLLALIGLLLLSIPTASLASSYNEFQKDSVATYHSYKQALSLTSKSDKQKESIRAIEKHLKGWRVLVAKYKNAAPNPFVNLPDYATLIEQPIAISEQALKELHAGDSAAAHSTLEATRYLLWKMRTDAGIVTLSDKVNDFHEVMEVVLDKLAEEKTVANFNKTGKRYGAWMAIKWQELASVEVFAAEQAAFEKALVAGRKAIAELRSKLAGDDLKAAKAASKKVKQAYKATFFLDSCS